MCVSRVAVLCAMYATNFLVSLYILKKAYNMWKGNEKKSISFSVDVFVVNRSLAFSSLVTFSLSTSLLSLSCSGVFFCTLWPVWHCAVCCAVCAVLCCLLCCVCCAVLFRRRRRGQGQTGGGGGSGGRAVGPVDAAAAGREQSVTGLTAAQLAQQTRLSQLFLCDSD